MNSDDLSVLFCCLAAAIVVILGLVSTLRLTIPISPAGTKARSASAEPPVVRTGPGGHSLDDFLEAVIAYESAGETVLVGDDGRSRGPAHISLAYWMDSGRRAADWHDGVMDREETKRCMLDYFRRYEPEALKRGDWETLARLHNSGPAWRRKMRLTDAYWERVKEAMP